MIPLSWPPPPNDVGSLPRVQCVAVADGVVGSEVSIVNETSDNGGDSCGIHFPDEERAAAATRTTTSVPLPSDAFAITHLVGLARLMAAFSCAADGGAGDGRTNEAIDVPSDSSSLLLHSDDDAANSSLSIGGRRRTSGSLREGADHCHGRLPGEPLAAGPPRATALRSRRSAAEAIPEASARVPRAAPAPLLSSSAPLQPEGEDATGRAGCRRSAKNRIAAGIDGWALIGDVADGAVSLGGRGHGGHQGIPQEAQRCKEVRQVPIPGSPSPIPRGPQAPIAEGSPQGLPLLPAWPAR